MKKPRKPGKKIQLPKKENEWKKGIDGWVDEILDKWENGNLKGKKMSNLPKDDKGELPYHEYHLCGEDNKTFCGKVIPKDHIDRSGNLQFQRNGHPCPNCVKASIKRDDILPKPGDFTPPTDPELPSDPEGEDVSS